MKQLSPQKNRVFKHFSATLIVVLTLVWTADFTANHTIKRDDTNTARASVPENKVDSITVLKTAVKDDSSSELAQWLNEWRESPTESLLNAGLEIADRRRDQMRDLISGDPGLAIDSMLRFQDYVDLPQELAEIIEKPFAAVGDVDAVATCNSSGEHREEVRRDSVHYFVEMEGTSRELFVPEERVGLLSKSGFPMVGIELDQVAALHRQAALSLPQEELVAAKTLFDISGELSASSASVLVGNELIEVPETHDPVSVNKILAAAEKQIGPETVELALGALQSEENSAEEINQVVKQASNAWTMGAKKVLLVRTAFIDQKNEVRSAEIFQNWLQIVSDQFEEMSYAQTHFSVMDVTEKVYTLPWDTATYEKSKHWFNLLHSHAARLVSADGIDSDDYDIVVVVTSSINTGGRGSATIGGGKQWIRDGLISQGHGTLRHEFGHNYGLQHASSWESKDRSTMPVVPSSVYHAEYGDMFDYMGSSTMNDDGDFNVFEKYLLGWVDDSHVMTVNKRVDETFRVSRFDHPQAYEKPTLALKIQYRESETLWVMFRKKFESNEFQSNGAYVLWQFEDNKSRLLDMTPSSRMFVGVDMYDSALCLGNSFSEPTGNIQITTVSTGGTSENEWLDVRVEITNAANNPPQVLVARSTPKLLANEPIKFHARSFDPDGDKLSFTWDFGDGETVESTANTIEHVYQRPGNYSVRLTASDPMGGTDSDSSTLIVTGLTETTNYQDWIADQLRDGVDDWDRRPENDYDSDGFANLMEHGLGLNPAVADPTDYLNKKLSSLMGGQTIELLLRSNDPNLIIAFYVSTDLVTWEPIPVLFDAESDSWFLESDILELVSETDEGEGLWNLKLRLRQSSKSLFLTFGVSYDNEV